MNPQDIDLHRFIDGQLSPERESVVIDYLMKNPEALERARVFAAQKQAIRRRLSALSEQVDNPLTTQLERHLERLSFSRARKRQFWTYLGRAAGIALLLGTGWSGGFLYLKSVEAQVPDFVEESAGAYRVFSDGSDPPVDIPGSAARDLHDRFVRHLKVEPTIPQLEDLGMQLVGGRLLAGADGPLARLYYADGAGNRLTLTLSPNDEDADGSIDVSNFDGVMAGYWRQGNLSYAIVGRVPTEQIRLVGTRMGAPDA